MRNIALTLGALVSFYAFSSAETNSDQAAKELQALAHRADERAIQYENTAKTSNGMEAFKAESLSQYFRGLAERRRAAATAIQAGNPAEIEKTKNELNTYESQKPTDLGTTTAAGPFTPGENPFQKPPQHVTSPFPDKPNLGEKPGPTTDKLGDNPFGDKPDKQDKPLENKPPQMKKMLAERLLKFADEAEMHAQEKRNMAEKGRGKDKRQVEEYADALEECAKIERQLATALQNDDQKETAKAMKDLNRLKQKIEKMDLPWGTPMLPVPAALGLTN